MCVKKGGEETKKKRKKKNESISKANELKWVFGFHPPSTQKEGVFLGKISNYLKRPVFLIKVWSSINSLSLSAALRFSLPDKGSLPGAL